MPRIINSYTQTNPLAKVISNLGESMFGDTLTPELKRQKLQESQREEYGVDWLAKQMGEGGTLDANRAAEAAVLGGLKPDDLAMFQTFIAGNNYGPRDSRTTNAMAGAGKYQQSADAFDIDQNNAMLRNRQDNATSRANNADTIANAYRMNQDDNARLWRQFIEEPKAAIGADGKPAFIQQGSLTQPGVAPIPTNEVQIEPVKRLKQYVDAAAAAGITDPAAQRAYALEQISKSGKKGLTVYGPDGNPIVEMGGDAGGQALTNSTVTRAQGDQNAFQKANAVADAYEGLLKTDPTLVRAAGWARDIAQGGAQLAENVAHIIGGRDIGDAVNKVRDAAIAKGVDPSVVAKLISFDPNIPKLSAAYNVLLYSFADALAGQSGRSVTDKDIERIEGILGNPRSFFASQPDALARLGVARGLLDSFERVNNRRLGINREPRQYGQATPGAQNTAASPPAPNAKLAPDGNWYIPDPDRPGKYRMVQP